MADDQTLVPKDRGTHDPAPSPATVESTGPMLQYASPNTDADLRRERRENASWRWGPFCFGVVNAPISLVALGALATSSGWLAAVVGFVGLIILLIMLVDARNSAFAAGFFAGIGLICISIFTLCFARF